MSDWLTDTITRHPEWESYKDPVDISKCRKALKRFINQKARLCVPAQPGDDDFLIGRALNELEEYRKKSTFIKVSQPELEFFSDHFSDLCEKYPNEWLAIDGDEVLAHGLDAAEVATLAEKNGCNNPFMVIASKEAFQCPHV